MKQTSVSHRSTESEIISLDAGLRMDGLPALDLWDICYQGDTYNQGQHSTWSQKLRETWVCSTQLDDSRTKTKRVNRKQGVDQLNELHCVPTNTRSSQGESQLYISEDNEAVIKIVIKGRSPTLRHVSRTHSVALDWLFDRINLDPKIQIKYVDTQNQLADILTKRSFSRNEWNHLLCLFNIMCFSTSSCSHSKSSFPRVMGLWWQKPDLPVWCCKASGKRAPDHMDRDLKNESTQKREEQHSRWPWEGVQNSVWLYGGNPGVYETEQNLCNPKFMMVSLLGKDSLPWHIIVWCISLSQCHKWWKFRMQKLPWTRNEKSSKQFQHGIWEKSRAKTEVVLEAQRDNIRVHFASLMDIRHLKNAEVELKLKEVERDVVKADSGACAVFTEQSSSASQMTAAKNHGCYCKITRLWWTSSWCNISVHPSKIHKSECPDVWIRFPRHKNGQNHERKLKNPWFLLTEICTVVH